MDKWKKLIIGFHLVDNPNENPDSPQSLHFGPPATDAELADFEAKFMVTGFTLFEHGRDGRWRPHREYSLGNGAPP